MASMQLTTDDEDARFIYKGKATHRSWPQLPEEIVRLITTHYLWDISGSNYCPQSLDTRKSWYSRMVYTCIRDAQDLEKNLMPICPEWRRAIEKHLFWNQAIHVLDPNDYLIFHMTIHPKPQLNGSSNTNPGPIHLTPYQHFRNILNASCLVCRLNNPLSNFGLATAKKYANTITLGLITVCREHNHRRGIFCGACLRDEPVQDRITREQDLSLHSPGVLENEDEATWPHIEATCRRCRSEWLWRKACASGFPNDREAIGGPSFQCSDWETRQNVEGFIEMAEGNIADVLTVAREKWWLRMNTKYDSLAQHLLAAQRTQRRHVSQEEEEEDSEEDRELMLMRGAGQVRDLSLQDWARHRILDGHWLSPADSWYNIVVSGQPLVVPTVHPCPWSRDADSMDTSGDEESHPLRATVAGEVPPTFALCEQAFVAHMKQFREIVGPAMRNIVRKIVMECSVPSSLDYGDPAHIARKMPLETVVKILREEEGVWYDGVDWAEKKRNELEAMRRRRMDLESDSIVVDDSDSMSSTGSNLSGKSPTQGSSSSATSPVPSTSTIQTTPSPCPLGDEVTITSSSLGASESNSNHRLHGGRRATKSILPGDQSIRSAAPRLLSKVPYVPTTIAHLPQYSLEAIRTTWREAATPLYQCGCRICERARVAEMNARIAYSGFAQQPPVVVPHQQQHTQILSQALGPTITNTTTHRRDVDAAGDIELKEIGDVINVDEEVDYDPSDYDDEDDEDEDDEEDIDEDEVLDEDAGADVDGYADADASADGHVLYPHPVSETQTYRYHRYRNSNTNHRESGASPELGGKEGVFPRRPESPGLKSEFEPHNQNEMEEKRRATTKSENKNKNEPTHYISSQPHPKAAPTRSLKRSSDELEDTSEDVHVPPYGRAPGLGLGRGHNEIILNSDSGSDKSHSISPPSSCRQYPDRRDSEGIPAKRARIGENGVVAAEAGNDQPAPRLRPLPVFDFSACRPPLPSVDIPDTTVSPTTATGIARRKRSSEELDDGVVEERTIPNKRARVDPPSLPLPLSSPSSSPVSVSPSVPSESTRIVYLDDDDDDDTYGEVEDKPFIPPGGNGFKRARSRVRGIRQSDMDKLIPMDDMDE